MHARIELLSESEQAAFEDKCFAAFMQKVDAYLSRRVGLVSADLADYCYRDAYDDGDSPAEAARAALRNEGYGE